VQTASILLLHGLGIELSDAESDATGAAILLIGQVVIDVIAVGAAAAFSLGKYGLRASAWELTWPPRLNFGLIGATWAGAFVTLIIYGLIVQVLPFDALKPESNVPQKLFEHRSVVPLTVLLILAVAPVCEEMFFRGFIFHGLLNRFGLWLAVIASGFLFALVHFTGVDTVGLIIPFTVIGASFALLVNRTGSLWNSIVAHFAFNLVGVLANLAQVVLR
jgi:membrane protease YdiL (CAAX protease family)